MNVVDLILVAILACVTLHFYFRKKKKALSSGKEKEKPIREAVRKEGQERACPVICVVFQPELEEEELAAEIADMYLHGRRSEERLLLLRQTTAGTAERRAHIHQV